MEVWFAYLEEVQSIFTQSAPEYHSRKFDLYIVYLVSPLLYLFDSSIKLHTTMEKIEKIQYHAASAISGTWRGSSRNILYDELGWECLSDRLWSRRLLQFFKIPNSMTPSYLFDSLSRQRRLLYGNTNPNYYYETYSLTTRYMKGFSRSL